VRIRTVEFDDASSSAFSIDSRFAFLSSSSAQPLVEREEAMARVHKLLARAIIAAGVLSAATGTFASSAGARTIIDEWSTVKAPAPPQLKAVTIEPKTTALLVLDLVKQTCNAKRRPRCLDSLPKVQKLLAGAREKGVTIVYSLVPGATSADIAKELKPIGGEPTVTAGPDKFLGTNLDKLLKDKGIKTVITVGTSAHGAVLYTASGASLRGYHVIIPVDGMSAENTYAEQYTAWHMVHAPVVSKNVTLTRIDMIGY
jgi:nicotinamidase-related amidase